MYPSIEELFSLIKRNIGHSCFTVFTLRLIPGYAEVFVWFSWNGGMKETSQKGDRVGDGKVSRKGIYTGSSDPQKRKDSTHGLLRPSSKGDDTTLKPPITQ